MDIGKKLVEAMEDFADRLEVAGGHVEATGLRSTTVKRCGCLGGFVPVDLLGQQTVEPCHDCNGTGYIRTVYDGTGNSN